MRIAVLSDCRLPTAANFPGHGLGKIALALAEGLQARGHEVKLWAGPGSAADCPVETYTSEDELAGADLSAYDVVIDNTHTHVTGAMSDIRFMQISHDREFPPTANAVFPSDAHRRYWRFPPARARVIQHGVADPGLPALPQGRGYAAYLGAFFRTKAVNMAIQAAGLAGVKLLLAGPTPPPPPAGALYVGALEGAHKWTFLQEADVLLFPSACESAGLAPVEAALVGTPSVVNAAGGAGEQVEVGVSGYTARDVDEMSVNIARALELDRAAAREWALRERGLERMLDAYEQLARAVAAGEVW